MGFLYGFIACAFVLGGFRCYQEQTTITNSETSTVSQGVTETADVPVELPSGKTATAHYKKICNTTARTETLFKKEVKKRGGNRFLGFGHNVKEDFDFKKVSILGGMEISEPLCGFTTVDFDEKKFNLYAVLRF